MEIRVFKCSIFQCVGYSNLQYSSPHCTSKQFFARTIGIDEIAFSDIVLFRFLVFFPLKFPFCFADDIYGRNYSIGHSSGFEGRPVGHLEPTSSGIDTANHGDSLRLRQAQVQF